VFTVSTNEGLVPFPEINKIEEHVPNDAELSQVRPALEQTLKESSPVYVTGVEKPAEAGCVPSSGRHLCRTSEELLP
jgi:hypothetical protein